MHLLLLCACLVIANCRFIPHNAVPKTGMKRQPLNHMLPNGQKVASTEPKTEEEKVKELKDKLVQEKLADLAKAQAEQKEAAAAVTNEDQKKKQESDEEKYVKMEMGYHVPGTIVHQGTFEVDPNTMPGFGGAMPAYGGGYPYAGAYPQQGMGYNTGYPGYGSYGMSQPYGNHFG
ncbi:uncharacterized protein [Clytia hemisphaerica]|uniref:Cnidarian restricted protein n=1 Tax=Clytia hemisphaerica TaxID=252671 RepID=A0A7M5WVM1_9CNID